MGPRAGRVGKEAGRQAHTEAGAELESVLASEDGKAKGRPSVHGLWLFCRRRSMGTRFPSPFFSFSGGRSDRLSPSLSRS